MATSDLGWEVYREGDPQCSHSNFRSMTYTSMPAIHAVQCNECGRELRQRETPYKPVWPEKKSASR